MRAEINKTNVFACFLVGIIADFSNRKDSNKPLFGNTFIRLIENCCRKGIAKTSKLVWR